MGKRRTNITIKKSHRECLYHCGPLTNRNKENQGNNTTFGFVVTNDGVVLIDSGGSLKGAN